MRNLDQLCDKSIVKISILYNNDDEIYLENKELEEFLKMNAILIKEKKGWKFLNKKITHY